MDVDEFRLLLKKFETLKTGFKQERKVANIRVHVLQEVKKLNYQDLERVFYEATGEEDVASEKL